MAQLNADPLGGAVESCKKASGVNESNRLKTFMQSLIYPAFLGTFIVTFVQSSEAQALTRVSSLALLLLSYFCVLFVETETTNAPRYRGLVFVIDVVEIAIMSLVFGALFHTGPAVAAMQRVDTLLAVLGALFLLPFIWRRLEGRNSSEREPFLDGLAVSASVTCFLAAGCAHLIFSYEFFADSRFGVPSINSVTESWWLWWAHAIVWFLLLCYFGYVAFRARKPTSVPREANFWVYLPVVAGGALAIVLAIQKSFP